MAIKCMLSVQIYNHQAKNSDMRGLSLGVDGWNKALHHKKKRKKVGGQATGTVTALRQMHCSNENHATG